MDNPLILQVTHCFQQLRGSNTEEIVTADQWLREFSNQPNSIDIYLSIIQNNPDEIIKRFAAIMLRHALQYNWINFSDQDQNNLFQMIIQLIISQQSILIRRDLVESIQRFLNPVHIMNIMPIIFEQSNSGNIEIALSLTQLICSDKKYETPPEVENILVQLFQRGFNVDNLQIRLETFNTMYFCARCALISEISELWDQILQLLDICMTNEASIVQYVNIMDSILDDLPYLCDSISLYERCIAYFMAQDRNPQLLQYLYVIINALGACSQARFDNEEFYTQFVQITFDLIMYFYEPADELSPSYVQKFEIAMSEVIANNEFLRVLWEFCLEVADSDKGKYAFLAALLATHERCSEFYEDKTHDITEFFAACLDTEILTIIEKVASAMTEFEPTLKQNADEMTQSLVVKFMPIVQSNPTEVFIVALTSIVSTLPETSEIFADVFQIAHDLLQTSNPTLQLHAIPLLAAVIARGREKVEEFFENIIEFITTFIQTEPEESGEDIPFKVEAVRCIEQLILTKNSEIISHSGQLIEFLTNSLSTPQSSKFELACLSALACLSEHAPQFLPEWNEEAVNYLKSIAVVDLDAQFKEDYEKPISENRDDDIFEIKYQKRAFVLSILVRAILTKVETFTQNFEDVIGACAMMRRSFTPNCQTIACKAVVLLSQGIRKFNLQSPELTARLISVAIGDDQSAMEYEVNFVSARAIRTMIDLHANPYNPELLMNVLSHFCGFIIEMEDWKGCDDFVLLIKSICNHLAKTDFNNLRLFAQQMMSVQNESKTHYNVALCVISFTLAAAPSQFDENFKQQILALQNEKVQSLETISSSVFIRDISITDRAFFTPLAQTSFEALLNAITSPLVDSVAGRKITHYATVAIMHLVLNVIPDALNVDVADAILSVLPLKMDSEGDTNLEAQFVINVYKRTEGMFNMKIAEIIDDELSPHSTRGNCLAAETVVALKEIFQQIEATGILGG